MLALLPCPRTRWSAPASVGPTPTRRVPFVSTVRCPAEAAGSDTAEEAWLRAHAAQQLSPLLSEAGAVRLRGFGLPRTKAGFRRLCEALAFRPCDDALSSIGVRSLLSPADGIFEAVDAPALSSTFIGLHNDVTYRLGAPFAAFACFRAAARGGEFLLADGRAVLGALSPEVVDSLSRRKLRVRVAGWDGAGALLAAAGPLREPLARGIASVAGAVVGAAFPLQLEVRWSEDLRRLDVLEPPKSPTNCHPVSGEPSFFSGIHSQSRYLQQRRAGSSFGGVAATDVFYGDMQPIEKEVLEHIDEVISKLTVRVAMREGDVVLLDSYQVLHGRDTFEGAREHAVLWLTNDGFAGGEAAEAGRPGGTVSDLINRLAVKQER